MKQGIEKIAAGWRLTGGNLVLELDSDSGCLRSLEVVSGKPFMWSAFSGNVTVRDDLLRREFDRRDMENIRIRQENDTLIVESHCKYAPWMLEEIYKLEKDAIRWDAKLILDAGDFRSCAITYNLPWPQPLYPMKFWAARDDMPSAPHRFAEIALEYGEITSGILMPALCSYLEKENVGLLVTMPFDFKTPRFRFLSGYREADLRMQFDRMALAPKTTARASLLFRGTGGAWRPALGWLYERFQQYFDPRSSNIHDLWGGHVSGFAHVSDDEVTVMKELGLKWYEQHGHFAAYGNYHPEGIKQWRSGHHRKDDTMLSVELIKSTMKLLKDSDIAVFPYIQVTGDGATESLDPSFMDSRIRDLRGNTFSAWPGTVVMNSDPSLPFGKDISRQIDGMISRYPEMDGVFLDQGCYNFLDTAHDDGITAINNKPAYMTGFNYDTHLEHLSSLLHPDKSIIANAPYGIGMMKYIDAFMAEGSDWLCDHMQYYSLAKPMFFLMYESNDCDIELMFQRCLIYGAGFTSYAKAAPSVDLYKKYVPLVEKLYRRRWVFDSNPIELPTGVQGNLFSKPEGGLIAGVAGTMSRLQGRTPPDRSVLVRTKGVEEVKEVVLHQPGEKERKIGFGHEAGAIQFDLPGNMVAGVIEIF